MNTSSSLFNTEQPPGTRNSSPPPTVTVYFCNSLAAFETARIRRKASSYHSAVAFAAPALGTQWKEAVWHVGCEVWRSVFSLLP